MGTITILKVIFGVMSAAILLFGGYHGLNSYLDRRIEARISNPAYLQKLARSVRPSLLFDDKGSIVADMGAGTLVKNISISKNDKGGLDIIITPLEYIGIEPVLEALDHGYNIEGERGEMFDWRFHLSGSSNYKFGPEATRNRFRLELIR